MASVFFIVSLKSILARSWKSDHSGVLPSPTPIIPVFEDLTTLTFKKPVNESKGFASKAAGVAPKAPIVESDNFVARMQKLAGII